MSWEYSERKHPCPCGAGTYTIIDGSNDWMQHNTGWRMDCSSCELTYSLHTYSYYKDAMHNEGHRWVKTPSYDKAMGLQRKSKELRSLAVTLAKRKYSSELEKLFEHMSKKAVWEVLHANIKWYKSLDTFYQHTKGLEKSEYLGELFSEHHLNDALKIIQVHDVEINSIVQEAIDCDNEANSLLSGN